MNAFSISLLAVLSLTLAGCGDRVSVNKTEAAASAYISTDPNFGLASVFTETKKTAEAGNAEAQYKLGWIYDKGDGFNFDANGAPIAPIIAKDAAKAVEWYRKPLRRGMQKRNSASV